MEAAGSSETVNSYQTTHRHITTLHSQHRQNLIRYKVYDRPHQYINRIHLGSFSNATSRPTGICSLVLNKEHVDSGRNATGLSSGGVLFESRLGGRLS
jgi:hypothetical protein